MALTTPRTDLPADVGAPASFPVLVLTGAVLAALLTPLALGTPKMVLLALGALGGLAAALAVATFAQGRLADLLFVAFVLLVAVPIDKYFGYRVHVGGWPGLRVSAADLCAVALAGAGLLGVILGRTRNAVPGLVLGLYACGLGQYTLSSLGAPRRDLAFLEMASAVHALALCLVAAASFRRRHANLVVAALCVQLVVHTGFAVAQSVTGRAIGSGLFGGPGRVEHEALTSGAVRLRPSGLFDHSIVYATFAMMAVLVAGSALLATRSTWARLGLALSVLAGLSGLALSLSRGPWIAFVAGLVFLLLLGLEAGLLRLAQLRRLLAWLGVGALLLAVIFGGRIYERLTRSDEGNLNVRFDLNAIALRMTAAHPFAGVGLANFVVSMDRYDPKDVKSYFPAPAHNIYLLEAAETGVPGFLLFLGLWGAVLGTARRRLAQVEDRGLRWLCLGLLSALGAFLIGQLSDFSHRIEPLHSIVWTLVGLLFGALEAGRRISDASPPEAIP